MIWMVRRMVILSILVASSVRAGPREQADRLFSSLSSSSLPYMDFSTRQLDARRAAMESAIAAGRPADAAKIATQEDSFYNITVFDFASIMSNRDRSPFLGGNDFVRMFIGTVRDNRDARELLFDDFTYTVTNDTGNFRADLVRVTPQNSNFPDPAGVLSSYAWGSEHLQNGTSRRAIAFAMEEFLCTPISQLMDFTISDSRVRRDVDRTPSGVGATFQTNCRGCHAGMDAVGGAYAFYEVNSAGGMNYPQTVTPNFKKNTSVFPQGYVTIDDSWVNLWTAGQNAALGWRGPLSGNGLGSFGKMLSESRAFSKCMARKVFKKVCARDPQPSEAMDIFTLSQNFEMNAYNLKDLFEQAAILPACLGN